MHRTHRMVAILRTLETQRESQVRGVARVLCRVTGALRGVTGVLCGDCRRAVRGYRNTVRGYNRAGQGYRRAV